MSLAVSRRISNLYSSLTRLTIWFFDSKAHSEKRRRRAQPLIFGHKKTPHCCEVFGGVEDDRDISKSEEYLGEIVGMMRVFMILIVISLIGSLGMCVRAM